MSAIDLDMKEHPILFSSDMVKAILEGRKTMTRRVVNFHKPFDKPYHWKSIYPDGGGNWIAWDHDELGLADFTKKAYPNGEGFRCPYGQVGDHLWVRETLERGDNTYAGVIVYKADHTPYIDEFGSYKSWPWKLNYRPSIFMPRWASRITLEITNIRVERLQEITQIDAGKEGFTGDAIVGFVITWSHLNDKRGYSWESNPWVWVLEFKRI